MSKCNDKIGTIEKVETNVKTGLTDEQVKTRVLVGLVNKTKMIAGKTYWEIIRTDVLTFFNNLLFIIAGFVIFANVTDGNPRTKWHSGLFFLVVLSLNIIIGLYQDLKAKHLMSKLKVITTPFARVIREGIEKEIKPSEIVRDDIIVLRAGDQVPSDSILIDGDIFVNESLLTGESRNVEKKSGDMLYSGSYLTTGNCFARVVKVGKDNYIESITEKAKAFKRNPSHILKSLKVLFRYLGIIIIAFATTSLGIYAVVGQLNSVYGFVHVIRPLAGQMVAMIPAGLYLLTSVTLASGVLSLYKHKANVQDFYSIEMLARSDVICVDKTGTITDGNLAVNKVEILSKHNENEIASIIRSLVLATKDENVTAKALLNHFHNGEYLYPIKSLPFTSDNKYSGFTDSKGYTYIIGALEFMNVKNKDTLLKQTEEYTSKGYRLLTLAKSKKPISSNKYDDEMDALAFVILQDHVKEDALKTFAWFQENGVKVKVISGDNALTVSEIARIAGIEGAEKFISLDGMSLEEVKAIANDYVVFGRVTPEQKEALVIALHEEKHTVAMVGDGVNDMLALKRADCSIAMNSGSLGARNVSHVVLMDNNFSTMPSVVAEGRRVINNLQRTGSLFLTKTFFAMALSLIFTFVYLASRKYIYPFDTNNLILWEVFGIGLAAFFIALEPDSKPIKTGFLRNILKNAIPFAALMLVAVITCFVLYMLQYGNIIYTGVWDLCAEIELTGVAKYGATGIAILVVAGLSLVVLYLTCRPLNLYRGLVVGGSALATIAIVLAFALSGGDNILHIDFNRITGENWIVIAAMIIAFGVLAVTINNIYKGLSKPKKKGDQDEN